MKENKNIVYGLRDPRNDVYYYVGKSTVGFHRPLQHLLNSHNDKVNSWVLELRENNYAPQIDIIEVVKNLDDLPRREKYWINYYKELNHDLFNVQLIDYDSLNYQTRNKETDKEFRDLIYLIDNIAQIINRERLFRNISQEEIAKMAGVSRSTLSLLERGKPVTSSKITSILKAIESFDYERNYCAERAGRNQ